MRVNRLISVVGVFFLSLYLLGSPRKNILALDYDENISLLRNQSGRLLSPAVFLDGLVSTTGNEFANAFSPDAKDFVFIRLIGATKRPAIWHTSLGENSWSQPAIMPFSGTYNDLDPMFSPDGKILFFSSNRPISGKGSAKKDYDLWQVSRVDNRWSQPVHLGPQINSDADEVYPSITRDGTLYFSSNRRDGEGDMDFYFCKLQGNGYSHPINLGHIINTPGREINGFIAPDGQTFLYSSIPLQQTRQGDLSVCFRLPDGSWSNPQNLGDEINSNGNDFTPVLLAGGKHLFFASDRSGQNDIYWIDAGFLEKMRAGHVMVKKSDLASLHTKE